jgi:hypothetical protein
MAIVMTAATHPNYVYGVLWQSASAGRQQSYSRHASSGLLRIEPWPHGAEILERFACTGATEDI